MLDLSRARHRMVAVQIAGRGVRDRSVLDAMGRVPREAFILPGFEEFAYEDGPLPIGEGQTISQPYVVALMIEVAEVRPGDHVLEVGAGSGYAAAVMSHIADRVYAIERLPLLGEAARRRFDRLAGGSPFRCHPGRGGRAGCPASAETTARDRGSVSDPGRRGIARSISFEHHADKRDRVRS